MASYQEHLARQAANRQANGGGPTIHFMNEFLQNDGDVAIIRFPYTSMDGYTAMSYPTNKIYSNWENIQDDIMYSLLKIKFSNEELINKLLKTEYSYIEYYNKWHDDYWGVCGCEHCTRNYNKLGKMLMNIREGIRNEKKI